MKASVRWGKFNLVGMAGAVVQLAALGILNRWVPGHVLLCTAAAIEITLLHNFVWHLRYTWRDRPSSAMTTRLLRFQLSNGMISLVGNLVLMRLLVDGAHAPVLIANAVAIVVCSLVNYALGDRWVFNPAI